MRLVRFRSRAASLLLAVATAAGLTAAATLPARASTSPAGFYKILLRVGTDAPVMCLQPAVPTHNERPHVAMHGEERSRLVDYKVVVTRDLPALSITQRHQR
jgi:hypothetical protein